MKKLAITLAALGLVLATACTKKDTPTVGASESAAEANERILNETFKPMSSSYNAKDVSLSNRVEGLQATRKKTNSYAANNWQFEALIKGIEKPVMSETVVLDQKAHAGETFSIELQDYDSIKAAIKGMLSVKGRCLDSSCEKVAVFLDYVSEGFVMNKPHEFAGYILGLGNDNVYRIINSVGGTVEYNLAKFNRVRVQALDRAEEAVWPILVEEHITQMDREIQKHASEVQPQQEAPQNSEEFGGAN